ncbi:MAG: Rieske 2Fe-2S domain-containing protein [Pseudomonadales bacterium]|nr:ubiquinol-cytochrome c reductase iron-sulfur subunit [Pseudomonadales bacterium]NIX07720.1 Rieske 2Fe-2S domain-containing protein [Pseudomonadales bacterium]
MAPDDDQQRPEDQGADESAGRREFLSRASGMAMAAGLVGGYGAFGAIAGRFLYPARPDAGVWQFVVDLGQLRSGDSLLYRGPTGETINITRLAENGDADDFIALSSTCPHLGCQVHWEPQNDRYFCPCHNGVFDPAGAGVSGPPGDAGQSLPRYPLRVDGNLLFIQVPTTQLVNNDAADEPRGELLDREECGSAPGHDPCLSPLARGRKGPERA